MKYSTYLEREDEELSIEVSYNYSKGRRGARDSLGGKAGAGPPLEPDDDPEIEILTVTDLKTKAEIDLNDEEQDKILEKLWDQLPAALDNERDYEKEYDAQDLELPQIGPDD